MAILNGFIAMTNVYFLRKLLLKTEDNFGILQVNRPSNYVDFFLNYHRTEIEYLFPRFLKQAEAPEREYFFLTEHSEVVGMISGYKSENYDFIVDFDFVVPAYRDCRLGHFVLGDGQHLCKLTGYAKIGALADSVEHEQYLSDLGMTPKKNGVWTFDGQQ